MTEIGSKTLTSSNSHKYVSQYLLYAFILILILILVIVSLGIICNTLLPFQGFFPPAYLSQLFFLRGPLSKYTLFRPAEIVAVLSPSSVEELEDERFREVDSDTRSRGRIEDLDQKSLTSGKRNEGFDDRDGQRNCIKVIGLDSLWSLD